MANFEWNQSLVANSPNLTASNFDLRHKIVSYHFYDIHIKANTVKFGLIYNGKSGSPFLALYEGDVNRDGSAKMIFCIFQGIKAKSSYKTL
jgi:hypothetical protein